MRRICNWLKLSIYICRRA